MLGGGANGGGQLGNETTNHNYPIDVCSDETCISTLSDISAIAAGGTHGCALATAGGVVCWGGNSNGQLGDGTAENRSFPVGVAGLDSGVVAIAAAGTHTCALLSAGNVQCWGSNEFGQLGNGTNGDGDFDTHDNDSLTPIDVCSGTIAPGVSGGTLSGVAAIDAGTSHTCALTTVGTVKCWGWNEYGQLGDGTTGDGNFSTLDNLGTTPVTVCTTPVFNDADLPSPAGVPASCTSPLVNVTAISAGGQHTCALTTAAVPTCWGRNAIGQVGDGTTIDRSVPVEVSGIGPKPTPTPAACGDVSDDGVVNAIDAVLVLQLDAGLIGTLVNEGSGDVNGDLEVTSIDAALILQFTAGLIGELAGCL